MTHNTKLKYLIKNLKIVKFQASLSCSGGTLMPSNIVVHFEPCTKFNFDSFGPRKVKWIRSTIQKFDLQSGLKICQISEHHDKIGQKKVDERYLYF